MMRFLRELNSPFVWKLAFRDAKPQWRTLLLYTSSVIAGVAALVAILSFRSDVLLTVQAQSKELLGADLELRSEIGRASCRERVEMSGVEGAVEEDREREWRKEGR